MKGIVVGWANVSRVAPMIVMSWIHGVSILELVGRRSVFGLGLRERIQEGYGPFTKRMFFIGIAVVLGIVGSCALVLPNSLELSTKASEITFR